MARREARERGKGKAATAPRKGGRTSGASWKQDPAGRRRRVLREATRLFSEHGYASVSTGDVARAAGVAEGSVFHYFGSKPGLLRAVGEGYGTAFAAAMFAGVQPVASTETIEKVVRQGFDFVADNWPGFGVFLLSDGSAGAPVAHRANRQAVTLAVENVLDSWLRSGVLADVDAPVVAELLFGLFEAALRACFAGDGVSDRGRYEQAVVTAISRLLRL